MWVSFHLSKIAWKEWLEFRDTKCELLINIGSLGANYIKAFVEWLLRLCELHEIYEGMSPTVQRTALRENFGLILVSDGKMLGRAKSMLLATFLWASWDLSYLLAMFSSYRAIFRVRISWWLGLTWKASRAPLTRYAATVAKASAYLSAGTFFRFLFTKRKKSVYDTVFKLKLLGQSSSANLYILLLSCS